MIKRKAVWGFAALVVSSAAWVAPAQAGYYPLPGGSYQQSCQVVSFNSEVGRMTAVCKKPKNKQGLSKNWEYRFCSGDIANNGGYLHCAVDQGLKAATQAAEAKAKAEAEAAEKAAKAAEEAKAKAEAEAELKAQKDKQIADMTAAIQNVLQIKAKTRKAAIDAARPKMDAAAKEVLGRETTISEENAWLGGLYDQKSAGDWTLPQALTKFLKAKVAAADGAVLRGDIIERATRELHGRPATPQEFAKYDNWMRTSGYTWKEIWLDVNMTLNYPVNKQAMLVRAFENALGREAVGNELATLTGQHASFKKVTDNIRTWLHSSAGTSELVETVKRGLETRNNKPPTDAEVKAALPGVSSAKSIYIEIADPPQIITMKLIQ